MKSCRIENRFLSLSVDDKGRIVSLVNKLTDTELIKYPDVAEAWRSRLERIHKVFWSDDVVGPSTTWHEATGPEAVQSGTGDALDFTDDGNTTFGDSSHAPLGINVDKRYYRIEESRD